MSDATYRLIEKTAQGAAIRALMEHEALQRTKRNCSGTLTTEEKIRKMFEGELPPDLLAQVMAKISHQLKEGVPEPPYILQTPDDRSRQQQLAKRSSEYNRIQNDSVPTAPSILLGGPDPDFVPDVQRRKRGRQ